MLKKYKIKSWDTTKHHFLTTIQFFLKNLSPWEKKRKTPGKDYNIKIYFFELRLIYEEKIYKRGNKNYL
jgi:hypothetical protein